MTGSAPRDRLARHLAGVREGGRPAVACFLTAGFPQLDGYASTLCRVAEECDLVEIGIPFSDPMADGLAIQRSSHAALQAGVTLPWIFDTLAGLQSAPAAPLAIMSYVNPLLAYGLESLARDAAEVGISALIVPDLPLEEQSDLSAALDRHGLGLVQLVSPATPVERVRKLGAQSQGFTYAVTVTGTTGGATRVSEHVRAYLRRVHEASSVPTLAGFGIRSGRQIAEVADVVDGVVVGSALVEILEAGGDPAGFVRGLRRRAQIEGAA